MHLFSRQNERVPSFENSGRGLFALPGMAGLSGGVANIEEASDTELEWRKLYSDVDVWRNIHHSYISYFRRNRVVSWFSWRMAKEIGEGTFKDKQL